MKLQFKPRTIRRGKYTIDVPSTRISIRAVQDTDHPSCDDFRELLVNDILDVLADINGPDTPVCLMNDLRNGSRSCSFAQAHKGHCWSFPRDFHKYDMLDLAKDLGFTVEGNQITL